MNDKTIEINQIKVEFTNVESGWLKFNISAVNQTFNDRFSDVYDPLLNFKYWLESISIGAQQTSFNYENEGNEIKFDLEQITYERCEFKITEYYNSKRIFLQSNVDRKQLVREFYKSLFSFYFSTGFNSKEWEIEFMKTKICSFLKVSDKEILKILLKLNRTQLINLFHLSDPTFTFGTENDTENSVKDFGELLSKLNISQNTENDKPFYWNVPNEYDSWERIPKLRYLKDCLNEPANGYTGTKIIELKSDIIENYIG